jgi:ABC-type nickel/cobalt efflux system permease component RcnA
MVFWLSIGARPAVDLQTVNNRVQLSAWLLVMSSNMKNTLENIIDEIVRHDDEHPTHGVGCACHDKHAGAIRRVINERMLCKHGRDKSMANLLVVLGYVMRNP